MNVYIDINGKLRISGVFCAARSGKNWLEVFDGRYEAMEWLATTAMEAEEMPDELGFDTTEEAVEFVSSIEIIKVVVEKGRVRELTAQEIADSTPDESLAETKAAD